MDTQAKGMRKLPLLREIFRKEKMIKMKNYQNVELEIVFFCIDDIVRTSQNDNVHDMPDFPENFGS